MFICSYLHGFREGEGGGVERKEETEIGKETGRGQERGEK